MFYNMNSITFASIFHQDKKIDAVRHEVIVMKVKI